jgi:hypothetical protein
MIALSFEPTTVTCFSDKALSIDGRLSGAAHVTTGSRPAQKFPIVGLLLRVFQKLTDYFGGTIKVTSSTPTALARSLTNCFVAHNLARKVTCACWTRTAGDNQALGPNLNPLDSIKPNKNTRASAGQRLGFFRI